MKVDPLTTSGKGIQGILFAVANLIQLLPLIVFVTLYQHQPLAAYLPYILFYTGTKTGLLLVNGLGDVQNAYRLARACLVICWIALLTLCLFEQSAIRDLAAWLLGGGASAFLPAYQAVYYRERVVWHWRFGFIETIAMVLYSLGTLGLIFLAGLNATQSGFWILLLFTTGGLLAMHHLPRFVRSSDASIFVANTKSTTDLELFGWLTIVVFSLRFIRFFASPLGIGFVTFAVLGLLLFVLRIGRQHRIRIDFPWWLIQASFLNGAFETFAMLYILFAAPGSLPMVFAYTAYGVGIMLAQIVRQPLQNSFSHLPDLQLQLIGFVIGSWLTILPHTLLLGILIIGFTGSANSILLNHQAYHLNQSTPANRLVIKYRNAYLGSISLQAMLVLGGLVTAGLTRTKLGTVLGQFNNHVLTTTSVTPLIHLIGIVTVTILTITTIILGVRLPKLDENALF